MISKAEISRIRLLHQKKHREEQGVFIVEGEKSCVELMQSNLKIVSTFCAEHYRGIKPKDTNFVSLNEMERISCLTTTPEILCIVEKPHFSLLDLDNKKPLLILDGIKDPGNLGTIIRTADWFGFLQILCSEDCVEYTNPKVIQASMGSFTRIKVVYSDLLSYLKKQLDRNVFGLYMNGENIAEQAFNDNDIVIIGSESRGISEPLESRINKRITISMEPHKGSAPESINAAIAAGIFMYEFRR